ncbi:Nif3-like dinuclear metal center hexameric protein [Mycoplasmopsis meleagridis]|uniref:Nif3-like dinuclear metal center hexameric protein n=1 Tax=Mycoplasmopsis meleagridis TaxID=29561 RepID=UPI00073D863F|nr:Nif3-like dinuclear metal center hexameric protein [Mycoplasmopsis meleagridis]KUH47389.1 hypothetical protein ASB56_01625 [Mycoplasmopsis meleagridis]
MQIRKLCNYLFELYPLENKEIWDPSGFSVKFNLSEKLKAVVSAIDLTNEVLEKALALGANLILVHHPFRFYQTWEEEYKIAPYKKEILTILKAKRINVLAFHTNFDNASFGTSKRIVEKLGLENYLITSQNPYAAFVKYSTTPNKLIETIKNKLNLHSFRSNLNSSELNQEIKNCVVFSGSGSAIEINQMNLEGVDLFITSDIKWSDWINYNQAKIKILEIPHLDEQVFSNVIKNDVLDYFKGKKVNINVETVELKEQYHNV